MTTKRKILGSIAKFGSALACLYVATDMATTDIHADVIDLSFSPDFIAPNPYYPQGVVIDELALGFVQWNDSVGKTMYAQSLTSINVVKSNATISPDDFSGMFTIGFTGLQTGSAFVGFRSAGKVGWFRIDLGGFITPINYVDGKYGTDGEALIVGASDILLGDVNCDGQVDLLDVQPFVDLLVDGEYSVKADMNQDGLLDLLDVDEFILALNQP